MSTQEVPVKSDSVIIPVNFTPESQQRATNLEIPDSHYQVFQRTILEHEFDHEDAFFSASLHRLQHGVYQENSRLKLSNPTGLHVTLVAITFVFHPMHSLNHRFKRAQISIQASRASGKGTYDQPLRIIKFAPHVAYGRISTESLHWTFSLGANIGVSQPLTANVTPATSFDRTKVIGTMLKIQGSSRSARGLESSKLVWSMEENEEQGAGLPREFTFVFLLEQPVARAPFVLQVGLKPIFSNSLGKLFAHDEIVGKSSVFDQELGQRFSYSPFNFATMQGQLEDLVELPGVSSNIQDLPREIAGPPSAESANPSALQSIISGIRNVAK